MAYVKNSVPFKLKAGSVFFWFFELDFRFQLTTLHLAKLNFLALFLAPLQLFKRIFSHLLLSESASPAILLFSGRPRHFRAKNTCIIFFYAGLHFVAKYSGFHKSERFHQLQLKILKSGKGEGNLFY